MTYLEKLTYLLDPKVINRLEECFGCERGAYIGKNPLEMLYYYEGWCSENGVMPTPKIRQQVFNGLKIATYYADLPDRKGDIDELIRNVPGLTVPIANILITAGIKNINDMETFVNPKCMNINEFIDLDLSGPEYSNADKAHLKEVWDNHQIRDIKDEAAEIYDKVLEEADVSSSEAPMVWQAIITLLALMAQPEPPGGSNPRPPG